MRLLPAVLLLWTLPAMADDAARLRSVFLDAYAAAQAGETASPRESELRAYVLYPYLQAARLRHRLERAPDARTDEAIERFLGQHGESPVARGVLRVWLPSLAGRREWARFLSRIPDNTSDPGLRCHRFAARRSVYPDRDATDDAVELWDTGQDMPAICDPVWQWMESRGLLTPERIEARAQKALAAGRFSLVRALARRLPAESQKPWNDRAALLEAPQAELPRWLRNSADPPLDNASLIEVYSRLTRRDSALALEWLGPMRSLERWSDTERAVLSAHAAKGLAQDREGTAMALFRGLDPSGFDTSLHEWRLRAALWSGDWAQALEWMDQLPSAQRQEPRWLYWKARGLEALGRRSAAQRAYRDAAAAREYYGFLAAERAGLGLRVAHTPLMENVKAEQTLYTTDAFLRSRELFFCELWPEAQAEWREALNGAEPAVRTEAARLAAGWGWHSQAVAELAALGVWDDVRLRYPTPYDREVLAAAEETGLEPDMIYAVLRQESLYNPRAASSAGAMGLLQLLPATAKAVARRNDRPAPDHNGLLRTHTNVLLGALYLREQLARFGGRWILSMAAYNAGPNRIPNWLPQSGAVDGDIWVENIPFNETRLYVQRILSHRLIFGWRRTGEPLPMSPHLEPVTADSIPAP